MKAAQTSGRRAVASWCLYDFANSAFTTVVVTFLYPAFFSGVIVGDEAEGTRYWARAVGATGIVVALLSPFLGAIADRGGYRKAMLLVSTAVSVVFCAALYPVMPGDILTAVVLFTLANIAFEMANVFYNAFLPDIAPPSRIGRISGWGWAIGYLGGICALVVMLVGFVSESAIFSLDRDAYAHIRIAAPVVAGWFVLFSVPMFLFVKEDKSRVAPPGTPILRSSWKQLVDTFHEIRSYKETARFLVARLLYNDGLITIFAFGGLYAQGTFGFDASELIVFGIALNVAAAAGAFAFGFVDDRIGGRRTIRWSLLALVVATLLAIFAPNRLFFWIAALLVGMFAGPNQAASRSLMGRFVPPDKENEFFGFFAFSGKATAFLGPFLLGEITGATESQRAGFAIVVVLLIAGAWVLEGVDEEAGIRASGRPT